LEEARLAQEQLAKAYGIHGFCYYHYWFNGKRLLHEPLDRKLQNPKEDLPFMMCWANENWTRAWDGSEQHMLMCQSYNFDDDKNHIKHLISYFKDERYIKVNGKPVFVIYRPKFFPDIKETIKIWREEVKNAGFPDIYIGFSRNFEHQYNPETKGFDFAFEFQPDFMNVPPGILFPRTFLENTLRRIKEKLKIKVPSQNYYLDYYEFASKQMACGFEEDIYPGITPMWDNSARRKNNPFILHDSTPVKYEKWLKFIKENYPWRDVPENFLFINAWNEWAEGNHLEPCQKWGKAYLEITKKILQ